MKKQKTINPKASNLLQRLTKDLPKKHIPVRAIKSDIASDFWRDGFSFIRISDIIYQTELIQEKDVRGKMVVNLMMSLECSLKSLIISLSKDNETAYDAFKIARNNSHDTKKLYDEAKGRSKKRFKIQEIKGNILVDLTGLNSINIRYGLELYDLLYRDQMSFITEIKNMNIGNDEFAVPIEEGLIERTIDNPKWYQLLRSQAVTFNDLASQCHQKYLAKHRALYGERLYAYSNEKAKYHNEKSNSNKKKKNNM